MAAPTINGPFDMLQRHLSAVSAPRFGTGIPLPNPHFRDYSAAEFGGTYAGEDGNTWNETRWRGWYYKGNAPNHGYGSLGQYKALGTWDAVHMYTATSDTTPTSNDPENQEILAQTLHSGMLPFSYYYPSHYNKAITLLGVIMGDADLVPDVSLQAGLACFNSSYVYLGWVPFDLSAGELGSSMPGNIWTRFTASTTGVLPSTTAYVQLQIGHYSTDGSTQSVSFGDLALALNPFNTYAVTDPSDEPLVDLDTVRMAALPRVSQASIGVRDARMATGQMHRNNVVPEGFKQRVALSWYRENNTTTQALAAAWLASQEGLGVSVPHPVPLVWDFGLSGIAPFGSYWHVSGSGLDLSYSQYWNVGSSGGHDMGLQLEEV